MWDLGLLALPLIALGGSARTANVAMVRPVLVLFGIGIGIFTAGGVSLLMAMSVEDQAAAYLALWSVIHLVSRAAGIAAGGILRDAALPPTGNSSSTYGLVFWLEVMGALACIWLQRRVDVPGFAAKSSRVPALEPMGVAADRDGDQGSSDWTRTSNPPVNSRMLCQLSYRGTNRDYTQ